MTTATTPLTRMLSAAINKLIDYDPASIKKLKPYAGKAVKVNIQPIDQSIILVVTENTILVSTDETIEIDTTISGKPSALFAMGTNQHIPGLDGVSINGDATTGQFIADFLKQLRPDWEEAWCDLLGEGPGYQVSEFLKSMRHAGLNLLKSFGQSSKEYLLEENKALVSQHEMDDFLDQVDDLKADVERIERKLTQIDSKQRV